MDQRLGDPVDLVESSRSLEQRSRHLRLLAAAVQEVSRIHDIPLILQRLVERALEITDACCGTAALMVDDHLVFTRYLVNGEWRPIDLAFSCGYGVPGQVIATKRPYIANDANADPNVIPEIREALQFYNLLNCPVLAADNELLGSFEIHNTREHRPFDAYDQLMLETLAAAAAIALQSARNNAAKSRAENALSHAVDRYRIWLEDASDAILVADADTGIIIEANRKAQQLTGRSRDELIGQHQTILHPPEEAYRYRAQFARHAAAGRSLTDDSELVHRDGRRIPVEISATVIEMADQRIIQGIFRDLSQRLATHDRLRNSALLFESTSEGIIITDARQVIIDVNPAFCQVTGYRRDEVLDKNPRLLQSGRHKADFYKAMWNSLQATGRWRGEIWNRRKNGEIYPEWLSINAVYDDKDEISNYVGIFTDLSTIRASQERLQRLAHHDPLTHLPNKLLFSARLAHAIHHGHRDHSKVALLFLDLDRFKHVNDTMGHTTGDRLLRQVAVRLKGCVREDDTVARLGGDEFTVILENIKDMRDVTTVARKIINALKQPFNLGEQDLFVSTSIGISIYPNDGADNTTLLKNADTAMYRAKELGRNNFQFYTKALSREASERHTLENSLHRALECKEFELHYQPQYCLRRKELVGAEVLIRWRHPDLGLVMPRQFLRIVDEIGLIEPLSRWVFETACMQVKQWHEYGHPPIKVAINLSAAQIQRGSVVQAVRDCLSATELPDRCLELELTEDVIMDRRVQVTETLMALKALNVSLAIDDFGTGYSSLGYLKQLPIDKLKIDASFLQDLPHNSEHAAVVRAITALGRNLKMVVVAEGVETAEQAAFLQNEDCDQVQGFHFGRPVTATEFERFFKAARPTSAAH